MPYKMLHLLPAAQALPTSAAAWALSIICGANSVAAAAAAWHHLVRQGMYFWHLLRCGAAKGSSAAASRPQVPQCPPQLRLVKVQLWRNH